MQEYKEIKDNLWTITEIKKFEIIENIPLIEKVFYFLCEEEEITEKTLKKLMKEFKFSEKWARAVINKFNSGTYLDYIINSPSY